MTQELLQLIPSEHGTFRLDPAWFFENENRAAAVDALRQYDAAYTGRWFDLLADHDEPNQITERDIVAVSTSASTYQPGSQSGC